VAHDKETKERFIHEAKAASGLDHPNICTIYEIDDAEDEQIFIAMAFYEGESLKEKIEQKPLEVDEAISIVTQIAEGLSRAHKKGIVHRDIKPANVMITEDGVVKIVDFGIAKLGGQIRLTQTGTTVGTTVYMSPEQTKGEEVDLRSDIWSLGVVLFEMLTGQLPFKGEQMQGMVYSILNKEPEAVTSIRQGVPGHIEQVIIKALEKDPSKRYQSAEEIKQELKSSPSLNFSEAEKSIVVLPFENLSPDKDQEYFCDGITEEIIADLSKIHTLRVISRTSAMMFKGTRKSMKTISRELGIRYALEGSVRKAGNNLRITAQLIDAGNDVHLWAEKYKGTLDDIFEIQENVSRSIVNMLKIKLSPHEEKQFGRSSIDNPQAYDWYLMARNLIWSFGDEKALDRALSLAEQGLELIGDNDLLLTVQGNVYIQYVNTLCKDPDEYPNLLEKARKNAEKALELNPSSAQALYLLGFIGMNTADPHKMVYHIQRSLQLDPNFVDSLFVMGYIRAVGGWDIDGAHKYMERAVKLDPITSIIKTALGWIHWFKGEFQKAIDEFHDWQQELEANNSTWQILIAWINAYAGTNKEAFRLIDQLIDKNPDHLHAAAAAALKYALQGEKKKAMGAITEKLKKAAWWDDAWPLLMADIYAILGESKLVFHWLERAIDSGVANVPFLMSNPFMANLHNKKKFKMLIEKAGRLSEALGKTAKASEQEEFAL
jgi:serine/threonine protein kinase/Tfp pilus assembly protein PilF